MFGGELREADISLSDGSAPMKWNCSGEAESVKRVAQRVF